MPNLCIIPARGGSKRIPKKNIKNFLGKPIISYPIELAIGTGIFDEVMVSTDDEEIALIANKFGAKTPFYRSEKNSGDFSTTIDVIEEVMKFYKTQGKVFDSICCIYPCTPLMTPDLIIKAKDILDKGTMDTVFPVQRYGHPIQRAFKIDSETLELFFSENAFIRTQDLTPAFHDAGQFYWAKTKELLKNRTFFSKKTGYIILSDLQAQDIDNPIDWALAELKYKMLGDA